MPPRPADYLLTNDDGIHAPGLVALRAAFEGRVRTTVAAPASNSSAVGHSITIHRPITCDPVPLGRGRRGYSVDGTPADCVKLALCELFPKLPRFVLSGINFGANLGVNVYYSGTVAAALEASFAGIPSFAISLCTKAAPRWKDASAIARRVVEEFAPFVAGTPVCLNVNIPNLPASRIRGVRFTHQAPVSWEDAFHRRQDPRGRLGMQSFWFQRVCQNHIVWDATQVVEFSRKHTANVRDGLLEIRRHIEALIAKRDARRDQFAEVLKKAMQTRLGSDSDEVAKELVKHGIPQHYIKDTMEIARAQGGFTIFALVDALTRLTQRITSSTRKDLESGTTGLSPLALNGDSSLRIRTA